MRTVSSTHMETVPLTGPTHVVPDLERLIGAARDDGVALAAGNAHNGALVPLERDGRLPRHLPDADGCVIAARRHASVRHGQHAIDGPVMPHKRSQAFLHRQVPDANCLVIARRYHTHVGKASDRPTPTMMLYVDRDSSNRLSPCIAGLYVQRR